jgi:hypothetical protein
MKYKYKLSDGQKQDGTLLLLLRSKIFKSFWLGGFEPH